MTRAEKVEYFIGLIEEHGARKVVECLLGLVDELSAKSNHADTTSKTSPPDSLKNNRK